MMKKAQQMRTMFPMGLRDDIRVSTTSLRPGARLMTLEEGQKERACWARPRELPPGGGQHCLSCLDPAPPAAPPPCLRPLLWLRPAAPSTSEAAGSAAGAAHAGCPGSWRRQPRPWPRRCPPRTPGPAPRPVCSSCSAGRRAHPRRGPGPPPGECRRQACGPTPCTRGCSRGRKATDRSPGPQGHGVPSPSSPPRRSL